jgi:hypothetical protein
MADKEATVYIIDVGKSMGRKNNGRDATDLDWALTYVWDKVTSIVRGPWNLSPVPVVDVSRGRLG